MVRTVSATLAVALLAAACSGSDAGDAPTTVLVSTSLATPPTSEASTTTPTTTVVDTTTTDAPPTTVDDDAALIAEIEQAYFDAFDAYHDAIFDPSNEDLRAGLAEHYVGGGLENVIGILDDLVELNAVARENPDFGPARAQVTGPVRFENDARTEATIVVCELNSELFVEANAGPNGEDSVLRRDIIRVDLVVALDLVDGEWKHGGGGSSTQLIGETTCDS